jgi:hypothetical protein
VRQHAGKLARRERQALGDADHGLVGVPVKALSVMLGMT